MKFDIVDLTDDPQPARPSHNMNGPEHYRAAEEELEHARKTDPMLPDTQRSRVEQYHLAAAQAHATLALTAATANVSEIVRAAGPDRHDPADVDKAWIEVIS